MTTEIVKAAPIAANLPDMVRYAEHLANANLLPTQYRQRPANVLYAMEYGRTLGITPLAAITGIHVIEGKPSASAALISGLVRQAGHKLRVTGNAVKATAQIIRSDDPEFTYEVTWELRRNANGNPNAEEAKLLNKDVWQKYPAAMLKARAISQVARDACEEVLYGLHYTPEELDVYVDQDGNPIDAPVQELRVVQPSEPDPWQTPAPQSAAQGRDYLHEARQAPDADKVRRIWMDAKADGAVPEYLEQIAEVGRAKATPDWMAGKATPTFESEDNIPDAEVLTPLDELRSAATAVGLTPAELEEGFKTAYGVATTEATDQQLNEMTSTLRGAA